MILLKNFELFILFKRLFHIITNKLINYNCHMRVYVYVCFKLQLYQITEIYYILCKKLFMLVAYT